MQDTKLKKWEILEKEDVSPSHWFPIERHTVKLPNGKQVDNYYVSPIGHVSMVIPITQDNKIVFVRQYKHGVEKILLELPAGYIKSDQTQKQAAVAELQEETGIKVLEKELKYLGKCISQSTKLNEIVYGYLVMNAEFNSEQNFDELEEIEIVKIPVQEIFKYIKEEKIWAANTIYFLLKAKLLYPELFN